MDSNWVKVYSTNTEYKAEIMKALLEEEDIQAILINKKDSSYHFGEIELYVHHEHIIKANRIITHEES